MPSRSHTDYAATGALCGASAFLIWGLAPIYFRAVGAIAPPLEVLAHRVVWSVVIIALVLALTRRQRGGAPVFATTRGWRLGLCVLTAALVSANWLIFIWSISERHLVEASLGYFINPLVSVMLGVVFLREQLSRAQKIAVGLATVGVLVLVVSYRAPLWISLSLAGTFALYGLLRKAARIEPLPGLFVETVVLVPVAIGYLAWRETHGIGAFGHVPLTGELLLGCAGVVTAVPLWLFLVAGQRLKLSTVGLMQYLAPIGQLLLGVLYGEAFTRAHGIAFLFIWGALVIYSLDAFRERRSAPLTVSGGGTRSP